MLLISVIVTTLALYGLSHFSVTKIVNGVEERRPKSIFDHLGSTVQYVTAALVESGISTPCPIKSEFRKEMIISCFDRQVSFAMICGGLFVSYRLPGLC